MIGIIFASLYEHFELIEFLGKVNKKDKFKRTASLNDMHGY